MRQNKTRGGKRKYSEVSEHENDTNLSLLEVQVK